MPRRNGNGIALLADPTRRNIVAILATRPTQPSALATRLGLSRPAVSRQLRLLADAELVVAHAWVPDGRCLAYTLDVRNQGRIIAWLAGTEIGLLPSDSRISARASRFADHDANVAAAPSAAPAAPAAPSARDRAARPIPTDFGQAERSFPSVGRSRRPIEPAARSDGSA